MSDLRHLATERFRLDVPTLGDLDELHAIYSDPRMWSHDPAHRQTEDATLTMLARWIDSWQTDGLAPWIVRAPEDDRVLGNAGCWLRQRRWWNLGYGLAPDRQGHGLAAEAIGRALAAAVEVRPEAPVVARILERNRASERVAQKVVSRSGTEVPTARTRSASASSMRTVSSQPSSSRPSWSDTWLCVERVVLGSGVVL